MVCMADSKDDTTNLVANVSSTVTSSGSLLLAAGQKGAGDMGGGKGEAQGYRWQLVDRIDWEKDLI